MSYQLIRNLLFQLDPELAHSLTLKSLKLAHSLGLMQSNVQSAAPCKIMQIDFPNRVGLAAGLDKNGEYINALAALGFGHIEIGTITPRPQPGNPKPRMFRLPKDEALINRLGFNNKGVDYLVEQVKRSQFKGILGINIGKNLTTSLEKAVDDYIFCMQRVYPYASYITINISSPNTPGLRSLQSEEYLKQLLTNLKNQQWQLKLVHKKYVPIVIKISPDLSPQELAIIAQELVTHDIDGVIATNTTIGREGLVHTPISTLSQQGGMSGRPLFKKSLLVVTQLHQLLQGKIPIIALGGIFSAKDAEQMFNAGASLVQVYTGFVYRGPKLIREII